MNDASSNQALKMSTPLFKLPQVKPRARGQQSEPREEKGGGLACSNESRRHSENAEIRESLSVLTKGYAFALVKRPVSVTEYSHSRFCHSTQNRRWMGLSGLAAGREIDASGESPGRKGRLWVAVSAATGYADVPTGVWSVGEWGLC